jgi:hypothetical protein
MVSRSSSNAMALVYKQDVEDSHDDQEELDSFSLWVRFLLCPVVYPIMFCYSLYAPDVSFLEEGEVGLWNN